MKFTPFKITLFLFLKLPSAFLSGVRLKKINEDACHTSVKFRWMNQNPFGSMYFAVQAMASELATGALVLKAIQKSGERVSMLVTHNTGTYHKKAKGRIKFVCLDGRRIQDVLEKAIRSKEGQKIVLSVQAFDQQNEKVSEFTYEWSLKVKS